MPRTLLLAVLALAALPTTASAATVSAVDRVVDEGLTSSVQGVDVTFQAAAGETNDLTITYGADGVVLTDAGAPLNTPAAIAGQPACVALGPSSVRCPAPLTLTAHLGDGDDRATAVGAGTSVIDGDAGDDTIQGGASGSILMGGEGSDRVTGGPGDDTIDGAEAVAAADAYDGGGGTDLLTYADVTAPVDADLSQGQATGMSIGRDTLSAFEDVLGGRGDDRLVGDAGPNELSGARGADTLIGGAGDDVLRGEQLNAVQPGFRDRIQAGPGDDQVWLARGTPFRDITGLQVVPATDDHADRVDCGTGADTVSYAGPEDVLPVSCDRVSGEDAVGPNPSWLALPPLRATERSVTFAVDALRPGRLLRAADGRVVLGRAPQRPSGRVAFVLTAAGRRVAAKGRGVVVRIGALTVALPRF